MARTYRLISSDSHLEIPPERWTHRVPARYRHLAPRRLTLPNGGDALQIADSAPIENASDLYARRPPAEWEPMRLSYADTAGTGLPEQRLREQDVEDVEAEVLFPGQVAGPALWRRIQDEAAYLALVRAYNEWLFEEYCAHAPNRLIGLGVLPWTTVDGVIAELEYCARKGFRGVVLGAYPGGEGYPTPEDDRFWAAALDIGLPLAIHVELRRHGRQAKQPTFRYPREPAELAPLLAPERHRTVVDRMARWGLTSALTLTQLTLAGVFERFPRLQLFVAESRIGWLPFWLENADMHYERNRGWCERYLGFQPIPRRPSEYVKEHIHWSIQGERVGLELRHHLGVERIMFATDFPHIECDFPETPRLIEEIYADVPEDERYKILRGNVIEYFRLHDLVGGQAPAASGQAGTRA